jgi:NADPH2:quinone reductase
MRAVRIKDLSGPGSALEVVEVPEPQGDGVLVEVHAAGVSFPELLQTRGQYQFKPELPFVPGSEAAGVVLSAPEGSSLRPGDRVAAFSMLGAWAEQVLAPEHFVFALGPLDFAQGAGLVLNYHTAFFALVTRGRLQAGETVLVHGAAGGVGTATLQVAKGLGARTIAVVSSDEKERVAREAGADEVLRADGPWKDQARELGGADVVIDPVGGDRFTDSLRTLNDLGRLVVVGFTGGSIPEVKVNRLLLRNTEVVGAGWGGYVLSRPDVTREIGGRLDELIASGAVRPIVGARLRLEDAGRALELLDGRGATGKVVLDVRD